MTSKETFRFLALHTVGNFLVLFGLFGVAMTFGPALGEEIKYRFNQFQGNTYVVGDPGTPTPTPGVGGLGSLFVRSQEKVLVPDNTNFSIIIPKIGADSTIIPNVDPANSDEYHAALQHGIAHAKGSVFPGLPGTTYLFAHSTDSFLNVGRYNAVFYLLKDLNIGDPIVIYFGGKRYDYAVESSAIVSPNDVSYLVNAQQTQEQLILQTCWPPGTTLQRFLVLAKRTN